MFREPPLISTNTEPSPPTFFDEEPGDAAQDRGENQTHGDDRETDNFEFENPVLENIKPADLREARLIRDAEKKIPGIVSQIRAEQAPVAPPADAENLALRPEQGKLLLAELDLDTAIRLRWAMRDIRSKRTKMSPVSEKDLAALIDLGLVEIREELPRLTGLGVLVLD
jgi:hypothetical protein